MEEGASSYLLDILCSVCTDHGSRGRSQKSSRGCTGFGEKPEEDDLEKVLKLGTCSKLLCCELLHHGNMRFCKSGDPEKGKKHNSPSTSCWLSSLEGVSTSSESNPLVHVLSENLNLYW